MEVDVQLMFCPNVWMEARTKLCAGYGMEVFEEVLESRAGKFYADVACGQPPRARCQRFISFLLHLS